MAEHYVQVTLPPIEILNRDAAINVWADETLLGTITFSRGSIDYRPNGYSSSVHLSWEEFDALMREQKEG